MRNGGNVGQYNAAGMPGITGKFFTTELGGAIPITSGALYSEIVYNSYRSTGNNGESYRIVIDANRSNSEYGAQSTVTPASTDMNLGVYLGLAAKV